MKSVMKMAPTYYVSFIEWQFPHQASKFIADGMLAGMAWWIVGRYWIEQPWNAKHQAIWILFTLAAGSIFHLRRQYYRLISFSDAITLGWAAVTLGGCSLLLKFFPIPSPLPDLACVASLLTGVLWGTFRLACRELNEIRHRYHAETADVKKKPHRTLVIGAGRAAVLVIQELNHHPELGYHAVGLIDDDPSKQGVRIAGVPVLGDSRRLPAVISKHCITHAILAMPSAPGETIRRMTEFLQRINVHVKTVPGIFDLLGTQVWKPVIRDVSIEDVLRRDAINLDHTALNQAVKESTVLITGGGGSIGSELARQLASFKPKHIVLLGRGENSLWTIQQEFQLCFPEQSISIELLDIRNRPELREVFEHYRPQVVLHAAAHKHVPFLEAHPVEAIQNNVFGTLNLVEISHEFETRVFVNISTDKAVNPTNVLGATKRIAECIVVNAAREAHPGCRYTNVRFGNVLGSRGSVIPIFREQIKRGGPLTVTHPDMTRYFMTIPEASQLVLQAGLFGGTGKVYLLDMGAPVKILDLATDMARLSGFTVNRDIEIQFVGLRPGEKLHEELFLAQERKTTQVHSKLFEVDPQGLAPKVLEEGLESLRQAILLPYELRQPRVVHLLKELVPTYEPSLLGVGRYGGHVKDRRLENGCSPPEQERRKNGN